MDKQKIVDDMVLGDRVFHLGDRVWVEFKPHSCIQILVGDSYEESEEVANIEPSMFSAIYGAYRQMVREMMDGIGDVDGSGEL